MNKAGKALACSFPNFSLYAGEYNYNVDLIPYLIISVLLISLACFAR